MEINLAGTNLSKAAQLEVIKQEILWDFHAIQQNAVMPPGNLSTKLVDELLIRVGFRESPHIEQLRFLIS